MEKHIELLIKAQREILQLRNSNELLSIKAQTHDDMMLLFKTTPGYGNQGFGIDINWEIDEFVKQHTEKQVS